MLCPQFICYAWIDNISHTICLYITCVLCKQNTIRSVPFVSTVYTIIPRNKYSRKLSKRVTAMRGERLDEWIMTYARPSTATKAFYVLIGREKCRHTRSYKWRNNKTSHIYLTHWRNELYVINSVVLRWF